MCHPWKSLDDNAGFFAPFPHWKLSFYPLKYYCLKGNCSRRSSLTVNPPEQLPPGFLALLTFPVNCSCGDTILFGCCLAWHFGHIIIPSVVQCTKFGIPYFLSPLLCVLDLITSRRLMSGAPHVWSVTLTTSPSLLVNFPRHLTGLLFQ